MQEHRVVVIGGGVAGLDLATHLAKRLRVTLVDREPAHVWKPMLHTIAAGTRDVHAQETAYLAQARRCGFGFALGTPAAIDRAAKRVTLAPLSLPGHGEVLPERQLDYDTLVLAAGSAANDFGTPGVRAHCRFIDSRADAIGFNEEVTIALLKAAARGEAIRVGIVGGGATGVELAAELVQLADLAEAYGAAGMAARLQVSLLEMSGRLLGGFPENVAEAARRRLESLGVVVRTGADVTEATEAGFRLRDGSLVPAELRVWAAGVEGGGVQAVLQGLEVNKKGQFAVTPQLRATRDDAVFALGDCASLTLPGQTRALPPTAQVAAQQARYLAKVLPGLLAGERVADFRYRDFGALVSLGGFDAYGSLGRFGFFKGGFVKGRVAQLGHAMLYRQHQIRLQGFWRGSLLWLQDVIGRETRPPLRLD